MTDHGPVAVDGVVWGSRAGAVTALHARTAEVLAELQAVARRGTLFLPQEHTAWFLAGTPGAQVQRRALTMARPLPGPALPVADPPDGVDLEGASSVTAEQLLPARQAAFAAPHPDALPDEQARLALAGVLAGRVAGPLLPGASRVARRASDVVGACLVTDRPGDGPFLVTLFRSPDLPGLGTALGLAALGHVAGVRPGCTLRLVVSATNPAQERYRAWGFRVVADDVAVRVR